jgi:glucuronoarabinoxylan endo-1,4-beta-xylanase
VTGPNTGLVEVNGNTVAVSGRMCAFATYSRFIRPGAVRIATTTLRTALEVSAFRNGDRSTAVIVLNSAHSRQAVTFSLRGADAARVTPYLTDTIHQLSAQTTITVKNSAFHRDPAATVARHVRHPIVHRAPAVTSPPRVLKSVQ